MGALFSFWLFPIAALAGLLSYEEIKKALPWLGRLIDKNAKIQAIIQNSLPSVAVISLNALLPFILEGINSMMVHHTCSLMCTVLRFDVSARTSCKELG